MYTESSQQKVAYISSGVWQTQTEDWQENEVNIVVKCFKRFSTPKL